MNPNPIVDDDYTRSPFVARLNGLQPHMMSAKEATMNMTKPSPLASRHLCLRRLLSRRRMEPPLAPLPSQAARPRGGRMSRLASMLVLAMLALSGMDGARPAAAQSAASEATHMLSEAQWQERRERIRRFFQDRRQRRQIVATTVTPSGQTIDWIRPESLTADGTLAQPPDETMPDGTPDTTTPPRVTPHAAMARWRGKHRQKSSCIPRPVVRQGRCPWCASMWRNIWPASKCRQRTPRMCSGGRAWWGANPPLISRWRI